MGTFARSFSGRPKALAVGGESTERRGLRALLTPADFDLIEAAEGGTGLRGLYNERPDVVLLDFHLPDASGFDVLDRIREVSEVPLVALSAATAPASGCGRCGREPTIASPNRSGPNSWRGSKLC